MKPLHQQPEVRHQKPEASHKPLHSGDTVTVTSKPETRDQKSEVSKQTAAAAAPKEAPEPKEPSPTDRLVSALEALTNAATGKLSPGNTALIQAQDAIRNAPKKAE